MGIPLFPTPRPDETFYSLIARYRVWSDLSVTQVQLNLFGKKRKLGLALPGDLNYFYSMLPENSTLLPQVLIDRHTIFPIFYPYMDNADKIKIINAMTNTNSTYVSSVFAGVNKYVSYHQRICPICITKDEELYGEPYFHRVHQLRGAVYCPEHRVPLLNTVICDDCKSEHRCDALTNDTLLAKLQITLSGSHETTLISVSATYFWLLNNQPTFIGHAELRNRYKWHLQQKGLITKSGNLKIGDIHEQFTLFYPSFLLDECFYTKINPETWFHSILYPDPKGLANPLRHVLLMVFLGVNPEKFFGEGPLDKTVISKNSWPCLNPFCEYYSKPVINEYSRKNSRRRLYGIFKCSCGYSYERDVTNIDDSTEIRHRVKSYGQKWEQTVWKLYYDDNLSKNSIAKRAQVLPSTLDRQLTLLFSQKGIQWPIAEERRKRYREKITELMEKFPNASRSVLQDKCPRAYNWLNSHDHSWMHENLPKSKRLSLSFEQKRDRLRKKFLQLLRTYPDAKRYILQKVYNSGYKWLRDYDHAWFEQNMPAITDPKKRNKKWTGPLEINFLAKKFEGLPRR